MSAPGFLFLRQWCILGKMVRLNDYQLKQLADFTSNISILFLGAAVTPVLSRVDNADFFVIVLGLVLSILFLGLSLFILRRQI